MVANEDNPLSPYVPINRWDNKLYYLDNLHRTKNSSILLIILRWMNESHSVIHSFRILFLPVVSLPLLSSIYWSTSFYLHRLSFYSRPSIFSSFSPHTLSFLLSDSDKLLVGLGNLSCHIPHPNTHSPTPFFSSSFFPSICSSLQSLHPKVSEAH